MVEKQARICDVCDNHVANNKCDVCSKDICQECTEGISLGFLDEANALEINTCEKCKKQFSRVCLSEPNIFEDVFKDQPEIRNSIIELIKNVMMLKKVSDDETPEKEEDNISLYPPTPSQIKPFIYPYPKRYPRRTPLKPFKPYYGDPSRPLNKKWWGLTKK